MLKDLVRLGQPKSTMEQDVQDAIVGRIQLALTWAWAFCSAPRQLDYSIKLLASADKDLSKEYNDSDVFDSYE